MVFIWHTLFHECLGDECSFLHSFAISRYSEQSWWLMAAIFMVGSACCLHEGQRIKHPSWLVRLPSSLWPWRTQTVETASGIQRRLWSSGQMTAYVILLYESWRSHWCSPDFPLTWFEKRDTEELKSSGTVPFRTFSFTLLWIQISSGKSDVSVQTWFPLTS